jgi:hypothetical protein
MVENLGGGQAIILQLPNKAHDFRVPFQTRGFGQRLIKPGTCWSNETMMSDKLRPVQLETQLIQ